MAAHHLRILVVDDDDLLCNLIREYLQARAHVVHTETDASSAMDWLEHQPVDLVLTDLHLNNGFTGMDIQAQTVKYHPEAMVVFMTGEASVETAVAALKGGAHDYLRKPFPMALLALVAERAEKQINLRRENVQLRETLALRKINDALGSSLELAEVLQMVVEAALREVQGDAGAVVLNDAAERRLELGVCVGLAPEAINLRPYRHRQAYEQWLTDHRLAVVHPPGGENSASQTFSNPQTRSLMTVPLKARDQLIGVLYVTRQHSPDAFEDHHVQIVSLLAGQAARAIENAQLYRSLQDDLLQMIRALANAVEARDPYTRGHSDRVVKYALAIGREIGFAPEMLEELKIAAILHDIGKIGIHDSILLKAGPLSDREYAEMKLHPVFGDRILEPIRSLQNVRKWVYQHHERIDGKGYPEGLVGDQITLQGRILIVAEVFDALVSERSYKPSWPIDKVRQFFNDNAGTHFDPQIVNIFLKILDHEGDEFYENSQDSEN